VHGAARRVPDGKGVCREFGGCRIRAGGGVQRGGDVGQLELADGEPGWLEWGLGQAEFGKSGLVF
jgi:hypothetical protein